MLGQTDNSRLRVTFILALGIAVLPMKIDAGEYPPLAPPVDEPPSGDRRLVVTPTANLIDRLFHHGCAGCDAPKVQNCAGLRPASCAWPYSVEVSTYGAYGYGYAAGSMPSLYGIPGGYVARIGSPYFYRAAPVVSGPIEPPQPEANADRSAVTWGHLRGGFVLPGPVPSDPYGYHFGPGYYRRAEAGHYRFPYFSYRRPWYHLGSPAYNRDTNFAW